MLEGFRRRGEQIGRGDLVVAGRKTRGSSSGTVNTTWKCGQSGSRSQTFFRPFRLARSETVRAVAVAAGTGIPLPVMTAVTLGLVVSQCALAAVGHQVERRICHVR